MSNVTLTIGGRSFGIACAQGEEAHIAKLGRMIDAKLSGMGEMASQSEPRMLLFAALLLADELHDAQSHAPSPAGDSPGAAGAGLPGETGRRLEVIATRLENLAGHLEGSPRGS